MAQKFIPILPTGHAGKKFITECTKLINAWTTNSPLHKIALKALSVMPSLLLQKPNKKSKTKEHNECLKRRLNLFHGKKVILINLFEKFVLYKIS